MLRLSRSLAKQLVAVFRSALELTPRQYAGQLIEITAGADGLVIRAQKGRWAVEYRDQEPRPDVHLLIPFDMLLPLGGREGEACLSAANNGQVRAAWQEGPLPHERIVEAVSLPEDTSFPALPTAWATNGPELLTALADAMAVTDRESSRYALGCLQLRGNEGSMTATDGRQVLQQTGFQFDFDEEVLVVPSRVCRCPLLAHSTVEVGKTEKHLTLRSGAWTCWLPIETNARFPRVEDVIPRPEFCRSHLQLAAADREFLASSLPHLPCDDPQHEPITLDLNGKVLVRARDAAGGRLTELVLSNSTKTGDDLRLATNRKFLATALELGLEQLHFVDPAAPTLATDDRRSYVWAVLDKDSQLAPSEEATVVESPLAPFKPTRQRLRRTAPSPTPPVTAAMPLAQLMQLHDSLHAAIAQTDELLRALQQHVKPGRRLGRAPQQRQQAG